MSKVGIVVDGNAGFTNEQAIQYGIHIVPMPFIINGETYYEGQNLTQESFYEYLKNDADVKTSTPEIKHVLNAWDESLKQNDEIVYVVMDSSLSSAYQTACMLAQDYEGKVFVVDGGRVSSPLKELVLEGLELVKQGKTAKEIQTLLNDNARESVTFVMVDSLKYLKKGGRVNATTAVVGDALHIKPILRMQGSKLEVYKVARTLKKAKALMIEAIKNECAETLKCSTDDVHIEIAYSGTSNSEALKYETELKEVFSRENFLMDPLTLSLCCHIGPDALGIACSKKIKA